ncbi:unnamed protein product [Adineta steineri]|uniref:Uncharacterized protein n=1 Tax=Adineta steineri TaxID=433720 RepID=A0A820H562_9BILA|nr:unnamed protein product [Adineta steineri]
MSDNNEQQQQQQQRRKKKKTSRGNRKLQRFRAKLKEQGLNAETITMMINTYNDRSNQHDIENIGDSVNQDINVQDLVQLNQQEVQDVLEDIVTRVITKRKRETRPTGVTISISQISMVQPPEKRRRSATTTTTTIDNVVQPKNQSKKSTSHIKPNYLNTSDHIFKKMLSTPIKGAENMFQLFDTPEKLQYARVYAQLLNDLFYLRLKQDFWNDYYNILVTTGVWSMKLSKQFIKENRLDYVQFVTQKNVEKYQQTTMEQLKQAEIKLNQHKQIEFGQSIDLQKLSTIILAFVRKGQQKLSADFQYKKSLLQFDTNDYHLVQTFYDLKPSNDQV